MGSTETKKLGGTATKQSTAIKQHPTFLPAPQKVQPKQPTVTEDDVRLRAYELYLQRGAVPGNEVNDWLRAEQELRAN